VVGGGKRQNTCCLLPAVRSSTEDMHVIGAMHTHKILYLRRNTAFVRFSILNKNKGSKKTPSKRNLKTKNWKGPCRNKNKRKQGGGGDFSAAEIATADVVYEIARGQRMRKK
jgi:hypothetical protein